nr:HPF/RaiA family ribosome-associated protein [Actinomycetota bacterium]
MELRVSAPGSHLEDADVDRIEKDLQKIDRRLSRFDEVHAEVRINKNDSHSIDFNVTLELQYGKHHLVARTENADMNQAVREAREDVLRQINDKSRGGHSSFAKRR